MNEYICLPGFEHLLLEESFVLQVCASPRSLEMTCEFVLTPGHSSYASPQSDSRYCFLRGVIRFQGVSSLLWADQMVFLPAIDATGEIDYGHIDRFEWEGDAFELSGDFGRVELSAETVVVRLTEA